MWLRRLAALGAWGHAPATVPLRRVVRAEQLHLSVLNFHRLYECSNRGFVLASLSRLVLRPVQQLRQLGDIGRNGAVHMD